MCAEQAPTSTGGSGGRENTVDNNQKDNSQGVDPPEPITHTETTSRTIRIGDYQIRRLKNGDIYKVGLRSSRGCLVLTMLNSFLAGFLDCY